MNVRTTTPEVCARVNWMGTQYSITVTGGQSAGLVGIFESVVPAGDGPPIHIHHNEDEVLHVIEGEYEFWLDGITSRRGPGSSVFLPRGVPHTFRVTGDRPGRNLAIVTPAGFENFFVDAAAAELERPADMAKIVELGQRYGLEFVGPAPWPRQD